MEKVTLDSVVEELIEKHPQAIDYGIMNGVRLMFCVGGYPMTLGELLNKKNITDPQEFVDGLNAYLEQQN